MEQNGYTVQVEDVQNLSQVKDLPEVPPMLRSCHTAVVDGYIIEGHVPVAEIERLVADRPEIIGLAVLGMPVGSPGMEVEGVDAQPFEVISFDKSGGVEVYASYPK